MKVKFDSARCKSCGLCIEACPKKILRISEDAMNAKGYRTAEITDEKECIGCMSCALVCPDCAIEIHE